MFYNILKIKDLAELDGENFKKVTLLENNESCFNIISIKKDGIIDTHTSKENAAVMVLEGEIELHFDAQKFTVKKDELLMFKKDEQHKVLGVKDSKFLLIKI